MKERSQKAALGFPRALLPFCPKSGTAGRGARKDFAKRIVPRQTGGSRGNQAGAFRKPGSILRQEGGISILDRRNSSTSPKRNRTEAHPGKAQSRDANQRTA